MNYEQLHSPAARTVQTVPPIPMEAICGRCWLRYGQHRVGDYACMNSQWKPGNGHPQWSKAVFRRAP
jgi:hypothetical protein